MTKTKKLILVFDLDDTLYKELDFLKSAYYAIATYLSTKIHEPVTTLYNLLFSFYNNGHNAFESLLKQYGVSDIGTKDLVAMYRTHYPNIVLSPSHQVLLKTLKDMVYKVGLITDGRSLQQRQKIDALGLSSYFDALVISEEFGSEKPNPDNYLFFERAYGNNYHYLYVGDNIRKDFMAPNALGWTTICLQDDGQNIHSQTCDYTPAQAPHFMISELTELTNILTTLV